MRDKMICNFMTSNQEIVLFYTNYTFPIFFNARVTHLDMQVVHYSVGQKYDAHHDWGVRPSIQILIGFNVHMFSLCLLACLIFNHNSYNSQSR